MTSDKPTRDSSRVERLRRLAETTAPDKKQGVIWTIIEIRKFIVEQKLRGMSWAKLTEILHLDKVHLTEGTLRNYAAQIGHAEAALQDMGNHNPTDPEIHAALRNPRQMRRTPTPAISSLPPAIQERRSVSSAQTAAAPAKPLFIRNPTREL